MTVAATPHAQHRPAFLSRTSMALLVLLGMSSLLLLRATSEIGLMRESGSDPQMPIWIMFLTAKLLYWIFAGCVVAGVLFFEKPRWRIAMGLVLLLGWTYAIRMESWKLQLKQQALTEARDFSTSPARLEQLLQVADVQDGYELDNRIAANPNTSPEILRRLYGRHQLGTIMILARSSSTPVDILQAMVDHDLTRPNHDFENEWIRKCLQQNPKLPKVIRQKLNQQPVSSEGTE